MLMASCGCQNLAAARCYMSNFGNPSVNRRTSTNLGRSYRYFRSYFSIYIYIYAVRIHTYCIPPIRCNRRAPEKGQEKVMKTRVHFPRRPLRYGPKETTKIWASRGIAIWEDLSAYFTVLRLLEIDVLLPYFAIPLEPETWAERESMQAKTGATHLR